MVRKHFLLPQEQIDWLKETSQKGGIPMSEVVRRIIDKHIIELELKASASSSAKGGENG